MKVLVIGGGGREHALVWKISQSPRVKKIFCAPGNPGIASLATCVAIDAEDLPALKRFALAEKIDLTVVGPEGPLSQGIVDQFEQAGLRIFGASKRAAEIESSKAFAKAIMMRYGVPTARGEAFSSIGAARAYLRQVGAPVVVKANGLAAGKGVLVCQALDQAMTALDQIMGQKAFGDAGKSVVIEEFLKGEEASFLAFTDGTTVLPLPTSQDHKAVFDGDTGPNTGGMGAYSPAPVVDGLLHRRIMNEVMIPTVRGMAAEGRPYKGVLYAGLMIDRDRIRVLEFNGRFGDPEAQPLLMRLKGDLVPVMEAVIDGTLERITLQIDPRAAVCVVMASEGYPGAYPKGVPITGLDSVRRLRDVMVFHAGTAAKNDQVVTSGGRVLGVTALGESVESAIAQAYKAVARIGWKGEHHRSDIGLKALKRLRRVPQVGIVMGSDSDLPVMQEAAAVLKSFDIAYELTVASAHRSPERAAQFAAGARQRGLRVLIAGAGHAAHLAGALAAQTSLPVIGVPIDSSALQGMDALLSTVQMPPGIPVATMAVGKSGARNAGILAVQILAGNEPRLVAELDRFRAEMNRAVERKAAQLAELC